jgi:hypothetical protein
MTDKFASDRMIVIGHYYENRNENLYDKILYDLMLHHNDTPTVIWDNSNPRDPWLPSASPEYTKQVISPGNPIHGRYLVSLIYPEVNYFLFQDDDLILPAKTIDLMFDAAAENQSRFVGIEGRKLNTTSATPYLNATRARFPEPCDMLIRTYACHRKVLRYGLDWILRHGVSPGRSETLLFTHGGMLLDVPIHSELDWHNLPEYETGLSYDPQHGTEIDDFYNKYLRAKA